MTATRPCLFTAMLVGALTAACGGDIVGPSGDASTDALPVDVAPTDGASVDAPRTCVTSADCRAGEECVAHEGCDTPSYCGPQLGRPCTDDLAPFCGCDGRTFTGSSTCPVRSYRHRGPCEGVDAGPPVDAPLPRTCRTSADCPPAFMCEGPEGCATIWTCVTAHPCTADIAPFCGCDGTTFSGSSTCPGRQYQHRGACAATDAGTAPSCPPQDARGEGACDLFLGYAWNGTVCVALSGCRCVGADCASLSRDPDVCRTAHLPCKG